MIDQYQLVPIGVTAIVTWSLTWAVGYALRHRTPASVALPPKQVAPPKPPPRRKVMMPAKIAERVVASVRANGNSYAIIPEDLDDYVKRWCDENGIEQPSLSIVRELVVEVPGVRRKRIWLNKSTPEHEYIRTRLRIRGKSGERPTCYWIDDLPDIPRTEDRPEEIIRPTVVRTDRPSVRAPVAEPRPRERRRAYA